MKLTILSMALLCSLASSCESKKEVAQSVSGPAVAVIKVHGSAEKRVGDLIHLDGHDSTADTLTWYVDTSGVTVPDGLDDTVLKSNAEELKRLGYQVIGPTGEDSFYEIIGEDIFLSSYPGVYRVVLAAAGLSGGEVSVDLEGYSVTVAGDGVFHPPPKPPPPSQGFGLASSVPTWLATVPTDKRSNQKVIKGVLDTNARLAADGRFNTLTEIKQSLGAGLAAAVTEVVAWRSFGNSLYTAISKLEASGKIKTPQDFGKALAEIAGAM